jgi:mono/diheme cytochrome c family protein
MMRAAILLLPLLLAACNQQMEDMPRDKSFADAPALPGGASAQPPVAGAVAREDDPAPRPETIPVPIDAALLARGQQRFDIFCAPCHSPLGDGDGIVVRRGFPHPPTFHQAALRSAPDSHFYDVITHGYGAMFSYADRVPPADRWAIVAYIRALQFSQDTPADALPAELRTRLAEAK